MTSLALAEDHLQARMKYLSGLAGQKEKRDSTGPAEEKALVGKAGMPERSNAKAEKEESDKDDADDLDETGSPEPDDGPGPAPDTKANPASVKTSPEKPQPAPASGKAARPGTAEPTMVFPGK